MATISDALSKLWRNTVSQEVTNCLNRINFSSHPLFVMTDLLYLYDKIVQATNELFCNHSTMHLSVNDGYCSAFQSLNEVNSVKVLESVAIALFVY